MTWLIHEKNHKKKIRHFRIASSICFEARLSAKLLIWKRFFIHLQIKLIFTKKVSHSASFWKWEFLELGNGLLDLTNIGTYRPLRKIPYSQNRRLGSTSCKPYFSTIFFARFAHSLSKICILSVFARTFRQRWPKYIFNITFVFHYIQEFGNELEGGFNKCKPPIRTVNSILETGNRTGSSCNEQKIGDMKLYASGNLRIHVIMVFFENAYSTPIFHASGASISGALARFARIRQIGKLSDITIPFLGRELSPSPFCKDLGVIL